MMCVTIHGAAKLLGVSRMTIWRRRNDGSLNSIVSEDDYVFIPIRDVAKEMGTTRNRAIELAKKKHVPLIQVM